MGSQGLGRGKAGNHCGNQSSAPRSSVPDSHRSVAGESWASHNRQQDNKRCGGANPRCAAKTSAPQSILLGLSNAQPGQYQVLDTAEMNTRLISEFGTVEHGAKKRSKRSDGADIDTLYLLLSEDVEGQTGDAVLTADTPNITVVYRDFPQKFTRHLQQYELWGLFVCNEYKVARFRKAAVPPEMLPRVPNTHAHMASSRTKARAWVVDKINAFDRGIVVDVGGGQSTAVTFKEAGTHRIHAVCPLVDRQDSVRARNLNSVEGFERGDISVCRHCLHECSCVSTREIVCYYSCHSLYHLNDREKGIVAAKPGYHIVHLFNGGKGYFPSRKNPEFHYSVDRGEVYMYETLNPENCYEHPELSEFNDLGPNFRKMRFGDAQVEARIAHTEGCQIVVELRPLTHVQIDLTKALSDYAHIIHSQRDKIGHKDRQVVYATKFASENNVSVETAMSRIKDFEDKLLVAGEYVRDDIQYEEEDGIVDKYVVLTVRYKVYISILLLALYLLFGHFYALAFCAVLYFKLRSYEHRMFASATLALVPAVHLPYGTCYFISYLAYFCWTVFGKVILEKTKVKTNKELPICSVMDGMVVPGSIVSTAVSSQRSLGSLTTKTYCLGLPKKKGGHSWVPTPHRCEASGLGNLAICPRRDQRGATLIGPSTGECYVLASCPCNLMNALVNRHMPAQNETDLDLLNGAKLWAQKMGHILRPYFLEEYEFQDLNWFWKWTERKRQDLRTSQLLGIYNTTTSLKCFVKRELYHKQPSKARVIQCYSHLRDQTRTGPAMTAALKASHHLGDIEGEQTVHFGCGMSPSELGDWMKDCLEQGFTKFYERDGALWDGTMSPVLQEIELELYKAMGVPAKVVKDIAAQVQCKGSYVFRKAGLRVKIKYWPNGTRKSGHNQTTVGNSWINAAISVVACEGIPARIIVCGDDCLIALRDLKHVHTIKAREAAMGITPEVLTHDSWVNASFISQYWYPCWRNGQRTFITGPKIGRVIRRLGWTVKPPKDSEIDDYKNAIVYGLKHMIGIPLVTEWLGLFGQPVRESEDYLMRLAKNQAIYEKIIFERKMFFSSLSRDHVSYDDTQMLEVLSERYGISADSINDARWFLKRCTPAPSIISHPVLRQIEEVDLGVPSSVGLRF